MSRDSAGRIATRVSCKNVHGKMWRLPGARLVERPDVLSSHIV